MVIVGPIPSARMLSSVLASLPIASSSPIVYADSSASRPEVTQVDPVPVSSRSEFTQADPVHSLFEKGSRYWSVAAGASRDESIAWIYFTQISASYYIADNLAIDWGGILGYVSAKRTRGGALGGPEVGMRWHFARGRRTSLFFEGIVGAVVQQNPITEHSLRFNFDLQPGGEGQPST